MDATNPIQPTTASADLRLPASAEGPPSAPPPVTGSRPASAGRNGRQTRNPGVFIPQIPAASPRVLVFSSEEKKLSSLSPFQRKDGCDRLGKVLRCDKLRDGAIEVEFATAADAARALKATAFTFTVRERGEKREVSIPMTVVPHRTKNSTKGIINCFDLRGVTDEDIKDGLSSCGVTHARRIESRRGGVTSPTDNIVLTFSGNDLPPHVTVGYVRVKVRVYIPNPMRCFRCQRFGHTRTHCRGQPTCSKCASKDHTDETCESDTLRCVNCGEDQIPHSAFDKSCPKFAEEKEINAIKATRNVSFREAREAYNQTHPKTSYAEKARKSATPGSLHASHAEKAKTPVLDRTTMEGMTAIQLVLLLKSFGLSVVASGSTPSSVLSVAPTTLVAPPSGAAALVPSSPSITGDRRDSAAQSGAPSAAGGEDGDDDWTLVQGRRGARRRPEAPPSPSRSGEPPGEAKASSGRQSPVRETAVMAALRRNDEEKRARDARRARLVERAREARQSPGSESDQGVVGSAPPSPGGRTGRSPAALQSQHLMGPPPPPQRPRVPPPPLPSRSPSGERPPSTPQSTPKSLEPPPAPARPGKRTLAWDGSPSGDDTPKTRHRPQSHPAGGRSSSADGRLLRGDGAHPRVQFGDGAANL